MSGSSPSSFLKGGNWTLKEELDAQGLLLSRPPAQRLNAPVTAAPCISPEFGGAAARLETGHLGPIDGYLLSYASAKGRDQEEGGSPLGDPLC